MAKLYFRVEADYDKVMRLREEITKLKTELSGMDSTQSPSAFNSLNMQIAAMQKEFDKIVTKAASAGAAMEGSLKESIRNATKAADGLTEQIVRQKKVIQETEDDVRKLSAEYASMGKDSPKAHSVLGELNRAKTALSEQRSTLDALRNSIKRSTDASDEFTEEIIKQKRIIRDTQDDVRRLSAEYKNMAKHTPQAAYTLERLNRAKAALAEQRYALGDLQEQQARNRLELKKLNREYNEFTKGTDKAKVLLDSLVDSLKRTALEIGGIMAIRRFTTDVIDATGKMQQLQVALATILQDKPKADRLMAEIVQFAATTPFNLDEVANGAKQLLAYGSTAEKVVGELSMLGDVASGLQIPIGQLIYLYGTLRTQGRAMTIDIRQFAGRGIPIYEELAKVLGVAKDQVGQLVKEGKVGFAEVEQAFKNMTSEGGKFADLMKNTAGSWPQKLSNIQDTLFQKLNEFGNKYKEVFEFGIDSTAGLVDNIDEIISVIGSLIAAYGTYKAVLITTAVAQKAVGFAESIRLVSMYRKEMGLATAAQQAFNTASKANVFAIALSALVGIGTAVYMFTKRTDEATEAQKSLTKVCNKAAEEFDKEASKVDRLNGVLKSETSTIAQKGKALTELKSIIPGYNASLDEEGKLINSNTAAIKEYLVQLEKQIKLKAAQEELEELYKQKRKQEKTKKTASEDYKKARNLYESSRTLTDSDILKKGMNTGVAVFSQNSANLKILQDNSLKAKKELDSVNSELGKTLASISEIEKEIEKTSASDTTAVASDIKTEIEETTSRIKTLKKEIEDLRSGKTKADVGKTVESVIDAKVKELQQAEKSLKTLTGESVIRTDTVKAENAVQDMRNSMNAFSSRVSAEAVKVQSDLERKAAQARIDAMEDGSEKIAAQRELNNRIELEDIEKQKREYIAKYIQSQKDIFDAEEKIKAKENPAYRKKVFDASSVKVDTPIFDTISADVLRRQNNEKIKTQEDAWNEYLKKFGSYQQKRKAITESYDKQIRKASTAGDAAILEKEKLNAIDELDEKMRSSATLMGELFADSSQKSVSEIQKIIDKAEMLLEYLASVKDEQGNAVIGGKNVSENDILNLGISKNTLQNLEIAPDKIKAIQDAVRGLKGEMEKESPFKAFEIGIKKSIEAFKKAGDLKGKAKANEIGKGISGIGESVVAFTPALKEFGDNLGAIFGNDKIAKTIGGISDAIGGLGQTAAGVGQIMSGDIVGGAMSAVGGIGSVVSAFEGLFSGSNEKEIKETIERLTLKNDRLIESLDELTETIRKESGTKAIEAYEKAVQIQKEINKNLLEQAKAQARRHGNHHSWDYYFDFNKEDIEWIRKNISEAFNGKEDLWSLSPEQMKALRDNADLWFRIQQAGKDDYGKDVIDKLNDYADQAGKIEGLFDDVNEAITGISFDSFKEGFTDALLDMESTADDFAKNFESQMQNAVFRALIDNEYADDIKELYDKWYNAAQDGLSGDEAEDLRTEQQSLVDKMLAERERLKKEFGWEDTEKETSSEIKGLSELQRAYGRLNEIVSRVYSSDRVKAIAEQNANLMQQKRLIEERIAIEKDEDSLEGYREQLEDINAQLKANKEAAKDAIFGSDVQSAINDFVSAYTNALGEGDTSNVAGDFVENMVKQMVVEAMKMDASPVVDAVRTKLIEAWKDGVVSSDEQKAVQDVINQLNKEFEDRYGWADDMFKHDEVAEKQTSEIEGLKELQDAYNDLSREMDKAYSTDRVRLIQEQIELLEQQKNLLEESISKGGDKDIIDGWEEQLKDINQSIKDAKEAQIDAIFGTDIQSAISSFANALIDAWAKGEDRAKTSQQIVQSIIRSMVAEMMKMSLAPMMENLRKEMTEMLKDGIISGDEHSTITGIVNSMAGLLENQFDWADEFIKDEQEAVDAIEESANEVEETFSNITFEGMRDDFVSQLSDMETSYEDMCNSFEDKLKQSIVKGFLESKYKNQIQSLISTWDMYGDSDNINEAEITKLRKQYQELVQSMIDDRDDLADKFGWSQIKDAYRQEATSKGFNAMDQETGDELNGRFTAMYESDLRRENILSQQLSVMKGKTPITEVKGNFESADVSGLENIADDTRNILANSYLELQQIRENTGAIIKPIKQMQEDIAEVKRNTERL